MYLKRWYFKNNYEDYRVLYQDENYILVQNINSKKYSFGLGRDFGSLYGFPVNQSCLNKDECIKILEKFIKIDKEFNNPNSTIEIYSQMIESLKNEKAKEIVS